jgi:hypothetical protein
MVVEDGYEFFNERILVTVFSAPNYCGEFDNWGAVMSVSAELLCSFELLKPLDSSALKSHIKKGRNKRQSMLNSPVSFKPVVAYSSSTLTSTLAREPVPSELLVYFCCIRRAWTGCLFQAESTTCSFLRRSACSSFRSSAAYDNQSLQ